jgi:hypothetical protein
MKMINVLQRLAEIDAGNPKVFNPMVETPVLGKRLKSVEMNLPEPGMKELKQLSGLMESRQFSNTIAECGMPGMGSPVPAMPASLSMTAANGNEIVAMMRGFANIANGAAGQASMPGMGSPMPGNMDHGMGDVDGDGDHDMIDHGMEKSDSPVSGPTFGDDAGGMDNGSMAGMPGEMDGGNDIADMMQKLRTGQPVKISTDMPVKVKTTNPVDGGAGPKDSPAPSSEKSDDEDKSVGENLRQWDTSPKETSRDYHANDFARIFNKVKELDATRAPRVADNPLKAESVEAPKEDSLSSAISKLFSEYNDFVNEGKKAKKDYDGDGKVESGKDEYMGSRDKAIKKAQAKK